MILNFLVLTCIMSPSAFGEITPSPDTLSVMNLASTVNFVNLLDGPASVSNAPTVPTTNSRPTLDEIKYYNNYAASMYCQYALNDLSCTPCQKFKNDVFDYAILMNNDTDTTALITVSRKRGEIVVTYRGTMNIWNVALDVTIIAVEYPNLPDGIKLHAGFHIAAMSLYEEVIENVGYLRSVFPSYKIVFNGHSLGAAMARITQFYVLATDQFPGAEYECYCFGEPRSGNQAFADYMNAQNIKTVRVVNNGDIVAHVPPTSLVGTTVLGDYYVHCQPEYHYVNTNSQRFCGVTTYEDPTCSNSLGPVYSFTDHVYYMDVSYATCIAGQPALFAAIPFSILQPVGTIPALPDFISNFLGGGVNFLIVALIGPILGG